MILTRAKGLGFCPPNLSFPWELGTLLNTMLLGITRVSLPNGITFCPTALADAQVWQMTYIHTEGQIDRPQYGNICHNRLLARITFSDATKSQCTVYVSAANVLQMHCLHVQTAHNITFQSCVKCHFHSPLGLLTNSVDCFTCPRTAHWPYHTHTHVHRYAWHTYSLADSST